MKDIAPACGVVVESLAGRDAGRSFVILRVEDEAHVLIADGALRKVQKPKRKKLKHLAVRPLRAASVAACLEEGKLLLDSDVRQALKDLLEADQKEEG